MTYFINRAFRKCGPLEKAEPGPIEKADPMLKFTVLVKKHLYDKLELADFKCDNNFLNLKPKITKTRHFWFLV